MAWGCTVNSLDAHLVRFGQSTVSARWIVGSDGTQSSVHRWAGLDVFRGESHRFGSRCHYRATPWSQYIEVQWGDGCQLDLTPVAPDEICVAILSRDPRLRFDDASGTVDPITSDGLLLALRQAAALGEALTRNDLSFYQRAHRKILRRARLVADLMLYSTAGRGSAPVLLLHSNRARRSLPICWRCTVSASDLPVSRQPRQPLLEGQTFVSLLFSCSHSVRYVSTEVARFDKASPKCWSSDGPPRAA
jgi:2-polyprenyl-6-methoxyphenol hydroxylase-like FAD-dependent oxidoreductase